MGQVIDFSKNSKNRENLKKDIDIITLLPKLKVFKGEILVFHVRSEIINDDNLLSTFVRDIATLKCIGTIPIIIPDLDIEIEKYYQNTYNEKPFDKHYCVNTNNSADILEVIYKHNGASKISSLIKELNVMPLVISGRDLNIIFPDNILRKVDSYFFQNKNASQFLNEKEIKKYSVECLNEIIKTDIIPIIIPTCNDKLGNDYIISSGYFAMHISGYIYALKLISLYKDNLQIPTNCLYGVERFMKIIKSGSFSERTIKMLNPIIECVKNNVQSASMVDLENVSLIQELCAKNPNSLIIYDDTLQQI